MAPTGSQGDPILIDSNLESQNRTQTSIIHGLRTAVQDYQAKSNYCLGGTVPIHSPAGNANNTAPISSQRVALRFDTGGGTVEKVEFPLGLGSNLEGLVKACTPATFGYEGRDILDEEYRKAGKLDREKFCVDFHPYDYRIVDAIAQTLLPGIGKMIRQSEQGTTNPAHWGVAAELYKLNVYSGPSGKFNKHVDTPRSASQFGSLVVCLPYPHQGGQLKISHQGHDRIFDWGNDEPTSIKWAAFYSDCEHEVLEVQSGHRVTLTYNLYVSEQVGGIFQLYPTADPSTYPMYNEVKMMLQQPDFMVNGGTFGFHCIHRYAHTGKDTDELMPFALKGMDATVYTVFEALGANVSVRPLIDDQPWEDLLETNYETDMTEDESEEQMLLEYATTRFGTSFHPLRVIDDQNEYEDQHPDEYFTGYTHKVRDIIWLNQENTERELAFVHMKYGNEHSLGMLYSNAVILIQLPSRNGNQPPAIHIE